MKRQRNRTQMKEINKTRKRTKQDGDKQSTRCTVQNTCYKIVK